MNDSQTLRKYPASKTSDLVNDSDFPTIDLPTVADGVVSAVNTTGELRTSSVVKAHASSSDKLEFGAEFGALLTAVDGATVIFNFDTSNQWQETLGGNRTLAFTNASKGQRVLILLIQDATGGRTVTWWSNIYWHHALAPVLDPTPLGRDLIVLECVSTDDGYGVPVWEEVCRKTSAPRKGITTATDGATVTFDPRVSPTQLLTLGGDRTLELQDGSYYVGMKFALKLIQDGTGSRTVTWWSTIKWAGNAAPTLTPTATYADWFGFICTDASASPKFDGFILGQGLAP